MNAIAKVDAPAPERQTRLQVFMGQVLPPASRHEIRAALPAHVPFERFERNLQNALMNEPRLLECNPREVFREVAKIAALGLLFDAQLGEAYLIASRTGPQARIGYRGLIKLGRQSGDLASIYAHEVHANDKIECILGDEKRLKHKPNLFSERGPVVGYYAVVRYKDGETDFEPMTVEQINAIRDKSDGWKAFKNGKIKDTPWNSSYDEMAKKTCIRRLAKRIPQSPDLESAFNHEDRAEFPGDDARDVTPKTLAERLAASKSPAPALTVERVQADIAEDAAETFDSNTSVVDRFIADIAAVETHDALEALRDAFAEGAAKYLKRDERDRAEAAYKARLAVLDAAVAGAGQGDTSPAEDGGADDDALNLVTNIERRFAEAADREALDRVHDAIADLIEELPQDLRIRLQNSAEEAEKRIKALPVEEDPHAALKDAARKKAQSGTKKLKLWLGSLNPDQTAALSTIRPELDAVANRADENLAAMEGR